ncbi:hypothetical protein [Luteococcus peritonei]|uniref:DUF4352 domain-containing protein n=1 Tax=Luteococcus peritonei TaxID=88874 RepID=A0ABW4RSI1_9ACTN
MTPSIPLRRGLAAATAGLLLLGAAGCDGEQPAATSASPAADTATGTASAAPASVAAKSRAEARAKAGTTPAAGHAGEPQRPAARPSPVVSTPVEPPRRGNIKQTVAPSPVASAATVAFGQDSHVSDDVVVRVSATKAVTTSAKVPGDVAGPGVLVTVTVENRSEQPLDASNAVVTLTASDQSPAVMNLGEPTEMFSGVVAPGATASADYAFRVARNKRRPVTVQVTVDPALKVASFTGDVA